MTNEEMERAVDKAREIPGWTMRSELLVLARLASQVREGGLILEIGGLRGRSTVAMALCTMARVFVVDSFVEGHATAMLDWLSNTQPFSHVMLWRLDSRAAVKRWRLPIDLLFVDGGHSYEEAHSDIFGFGPYVPSKGHIVVHDWGTPDVKRAATEWMEAYGWQVCEQVGDLIVLRR